MHWGVFEELRPREFRSILERYPVAYVPFGAYEWHGEALPFATDTLCVQDTARGVARTLGGVVLSASDGAIIYTSASSVKLGRSCTSLSGPLRLLKQCDRMPSALYLTPAPDHSIWPRSAVF